MWKLIRSDWPLVLILSITGIIILRELTGLAGSRRRPQGPGGAPDSSWVAPSLFTDRELEGKDRVLVIYGEDIIAHTSRYFGPQGSVARISNGMNCQNCHLNGGRKNWGNNYSAVYSTYPKFRDRSGSVENIYKRVSDCFERSLNGLAPDSNSREYQAIYAYLKWLGKDVKKGVKPFGSGIEKLPLLDRAADSEKGRLVYAAQCQNCHGENGEGRLDLTGTNYDYPPLWGEHSYNDGAGLYRLSNFAGYIKSNMPFNQATHQDPKLTTAEAWDVAAFVNSRPRPRGDFSGDWPDISKKPFDYPYGPYADGFSETEHKYGPYQPIIARIKELAKKN